MKIFYFIFILISFSYSQDVSFEIIPKQKIDNFFIPNKKPELKLQIIMNQKVKINGEWYKVGNKILDYQLTKIDYMGVELKNNQNTFYLKIRSSKIRALD